MSIAVDSDFYDELRKEGATRRASLSRYYEDEPIIDGVELPPSDGVPLVAEIPEHVRAIEDEAKALTTDAPRPTGGTSLIQSSSQFISGFSAPDYLIDGILQRRFIYSMTGRTGGGKTSLLTTIAGSVFLGRSIGPHEVQRGRVLYLAGENPDDLRMRWIAESQQMDFDPETSDVHFIAGRFKISEMFARLEAEASEKGPFALVIVDTAAAFFEGDDENSNAQQGANARRLRNLVNLAGGPCVIVAAHPPKNASDDNLQPRGGGAFIAEVDGNLTARRSDGLVELHWQGKFRGPDFAPLTFQLRGVTHERLRDTQGRLIPTVVAVHLSQTAQEEIEAAARGDENRVLEYYAYNPKASLADAARALGWKMKDGSPYKVRVDRVRTKLEKHKLVTVERDETVFTAKGRKALGVVTADAKIDTSDRDRNAVTTSCYENGETQQ